MKSKVSSVDFAARYDLKRCLKSDFLFPLLAFLFLSTATVLACLQNKDAQTKAVYILFESDGLFYYLTPIYQCIMMVIGVFTGIKAFSFLTSVKKTNVYLSVGITRMQLVRNRMVSCILYLFAAVFSPMLLNTILNAAFYSVTIGLIKAQLYYGFALFADLLLGFAIAAVITVSVGNVVEALVFSGILCAAPTVLFFCLQILMMNFVNGSAFAFNRHSAMLFEQTAINWITDFPDYNPLLFLCGKTEYAALEAERAVEGIPSSFVLPVLCWLIVGCALLALVPVLVKKRKAEDAGRFGMNKGTVVLTGGLGALAAFSLTSLLVRSGLHRFAVTAIGTVLACVVYFLVIAVIYRNKDILKRLYGLPVVAAVCIAGAVVCFTGVFGVYTRAPEAEDIECAYMTINADDPLIYCGSSYMTDLGLTSGNDIAGKFTDAADLKKVTELHKAVTAGLNQGQEKVGILYKLKNGSKQIRFYHHVSADAACRTNELLDTAWYDQHVDAAFGNREIAFPDAASYAWDETLEENLLTYFAGSVRQNLTAEGVALLNPSLTDGMLLSDSLTVQECLHLKACVAEDLKAIRSAELFYPKETPVCVLRFGDMPNTGHNWKDFKITTPVDDLYGLDIPVYSSMTKTMAFLAQHDLAVSKVTVKDIVSVKIMSMDNQVVQDSRIYDAFDMESNNVAIHTCSVSKVAADALRQGFAEMRETPYNFFDSCQKIEDKAQIEALLKVCRYSYDTTGDNGCIVQFTLQSGAIFTAYVPEKNLPDFVK